MRGYIILLVMLSVASAIMAQSAELTNLQTIDLAQAKALALDRNPGYQAVQSSVEAAGWSKRSALSSFLPSLSFGANYLWMDPATSYMSGNQFVTLNKDIRSMSLSLSQPLFMGGRLWQAYKLASAGEEIAKLSEGSARQELMAEVESKYLSVLQLKKVYQLSGSELRSAQKDLELAELKLENGLLARADHLRFQANLANKEVAQLQAQTALQLALRDFANYLGQPEPLMPEEIPLDTQSQLISTLQGFDLGNTQSLVDKASLLLEGRNLSLKILDRSQELSDRAYKMAKAAFLPSVILTGSHQFEENGIDRYEFDQSDQILLNFSLPLLPAWGSYADLKKAKAETLKTRLEARSASDGIKLGTQAAVINWVSTAKQLKSAQTSLSYSEELYEQLQERFRQNMLSSSELLDAEMMLSAARLNHNNAYYSYLKSRSALMKLLALEDGAELDQLVTQ